MNIGYLYSGKIVKNSESFLRIAKDKNINVVLVDISREIEEIDLSEIKNCDIVYNDSGDESAIKYIKVFEGLGKKVIDSSDSINEEDKGNFYLKCKKNNIPTPKTIILSEDLDIARKQLIEFNEMPVILKRVKGTWGEYVKKAESIDQAIDIIKEFWEKGKEKIPVLAQEFIDSFSYRVTYIGDEIVQTAIKENNSWKCTGVYARNFKKFEIDDELRQIVEKIMQNFDIKICGIDLLKKDGRWLAIEVNTEPALDFFEDEREVLIEKIVDLLVDSLKKELKNLIKEPIICKIRTNHKEECIE